MGLWVLRAVFPAWESESRGLQEVFDLKLQPMSHSLADGSVHTVLSRGFLNPGRNGLPRPILGTYIVKLIE